MRLAKRVEALEQRARLRNRVNQKYTSIDWDEFESPESDLKMLALHFELGLLPDPDTWEGDDESWFEAVNDHLGTAYVRNHSPCVNRPCPSCRINGTPRQRGFMGDDGELRPGTWVINRAPSGRQLDPERPVARGIFTPILT